jgi:hypothetical protein
VQPLAMDLVRHPACRLTANLIGRLMGDHPTGTA